MSNLESKIELDSNHTDTSLIFISLYLLLLIFFVILNSTTKTKNQNKEYALKSIFNTFSSEVRIKTPFVEAIKPIDTKKIFYRNKLYSSLNEEFLLLEPDLYDKRSFFRIKIAQENFFDKKNKILPQHEKFINTISELFSFVSEQKELKAEITFGQHESILNDQIDHYEKMFTRIASLRNYLAHKGVELSHINFGLHQTIKQEIIFSFLIESN